MKKIVLAYSGGLDTSIAIKWLADKYDAEVITVTVDVGQQENLKKIAEKAEKIGVTKHYSIDAKQEFVKDYIYPSIMANGLYQGKYPLISALTRPLIAKKLVDVAHWEGATAIAHGCTGKGNDQVRIDVTSKAIDPNLKIIAPIREWNLSREDEIQYAKDKNIPIEPKKSIYSLDQNLWGRSIESGPLEQPDFEPPDDAFEWVSPLEKTPDKPGYLKIEFEHGIPISVDEEPIDDPVSAINIVNKKAGGHGVGIIDHIEDRLVGIKSREVYESPAGICFIESHKDLEKMVLTRHQLFFKEIVDNQWAWLVYSGLWVDPLLLNLQAFIKSTQKLVNGQVTLKMFKGGIRVVGRSSNTSLYDPKLATYTSSSTFNQKAAEGFIELWGLPSRASYSVGKKIGGGT